MKDRILRVLKFLVYPAFYALCLLLFGYLAFPYSRLKDRIIAEFQRHAKAGERLEIDRISAYWFTGVEVSGVKLVMPRDEPAFHAPGDEKDAKPKETVFALDEAHVRLRILPLLIGRLKVSFLVAGLGGEVRGVVPLPGSKGDIDIDIENVEIGKIEPLVQALGGVPLRGTASGKISLSPEDAKISKANGTVDLTIANVVVSDGKTKIQGLIELPGARLGDLTFSAEAKDGILKINKFGATGTDIELAGDGKIGLHDAWQKSIADVFVRFKFTDAYRGKNDLTKTLLGAPGSTTTPLIDMQVVKMKRAKRADGFYGFHAHGPLKRLSFDPTTADSTAGGPPTTSGVRRPGAKGADAPFGGRKGTIGGAAGAGRPQPDLPTPPTLPKPMYPPMPEPAHAPGNEPSRRGDAPAADEPEPAAAPQPEPAAEPEPAAPAEQPAAPAE